MLYTITSLLYLNFFVLYCKVWDCPLFLTTQVISSDSQAVTAVVGGKLRTYRHGYLCGMDTYDTYTLTVLSSRSADDISGCKKS